MMRYAESITQLIGSTPLLELAAISRAIPGNIFAKLEMFNPGGSIKDRIALEMIRSAEAAGILRKGVTVVEPTSGNTGIALAYICASRGYRLILTMPESMSVERRKLLGIFGAELVLTPAREGIPGAIRKAKEIVENERNCVMLDQFRNPANPEAHRKTTAIEILQALEGKVDAFVAGVGTGGTLTGVGEALRKANPAVKIIAVEPSDSAVLSGSEPGAHAIQGIGAGFIPEILNTALIDEIIPVRHEDAGRTAALLARAEGVLAGISSGAALWAAMQYGNRMENRDANIVVVFPDTGERYLSTWMFGNASEENDA